MAMVNHHNNNKDMKNMTSDEEDNNSNNANNDEVNRPACAACKHQRKKCRKEKCLMLRHFPSGESTIFQAVLKLFGISNVSKMLKPLEPDQQERVVESLKWEASEWNKDNVYGPYGTYYNLKEQYQLNIHKYQEEINKLQQENRILKENLIEKENCLQNYYQGSGNLSLEGGIINNNNNAGQVSCDVLFVQDQQGIREVLPNIDGNVVATTSAQPPVYYDVNHAQAIVNMGIFSNPIHEGQGSRTSYDPMANGFYTTNFYASIDHIHHSSSFNVNHQAQPGLPFYAGYPAPQHQQLMNPGQRSSTPDDDRYIQMKRKLEEDLTKKQQ